MTVKDVWETEGLVTTAGAAELKDYVPAVDALAVGRLKAAGAIIFGKSNTPLYAGDFQTFNDVYGLTRNPWDAARTAGGSSGGAGAAVAAGLTPLELGSDIGGSIRNPAHYNGVYGLKPSWGVVPSRGHIPGPPGSLVETDINCGGPLARSIEDLRMALTVVAGPVPEDAAAWHLQLDPGPEIHTVTGLRVAAVFAEGSDLLPVARDVRASLEAFAGRLADAGAQVDAVPLPVPLADGLRSWLELVLPIIGTGLSDEDFAAFAELEAVPGDDPMLIAGRALAGRYRSWARANAERQRQRAAWATLFQQYDCRARAGHADYRVPARHRPTDDRPGTRHRRHGGPPPHRYGMVRRHRIRPTPGGDPADRPYLIGAARGHAGNRSLPLRPALAPDRRTPPVCGRHRIHPASVLNTTSAVARSVTPRLHGGAERIIASRMPGSRMRRKPFLPIGPVIYPSRERHRTSPGAGSGRI